MKRFTCRLFFLVLLFLANSCNLDSFDFNKLSDDVNLSPEFVLPIAKANISVWDIIESVNDENDTLVKVGDDDVLKIVYNETGIYNYQVRDLLNLQQQESFSSGNMAIGDISTDVVPISRLVSLKDVTDAVNGAIDNIVPLNGTVAVFPSTNFTGPPPAYFDVPGIDDFTWVKFSDGELEITLENRLDVPITLQGGLIDMQNSQGFAAISISNLNPNQTETITVPLGGKTISNQINFRLVKFQTFSTGLPSLIDLNDYFKLNLNFKGIKISEGNVKPKYQVLEGYSGSFDFEFESGIKVFEAVLKRGFMEVSSSNNSQISGTINLVFPEIKKGGTPVQLSVPFNGNAYTINLINAKVDLSTDETTPYNKVPYEYSVTINSSPNYINIYTTDALSLNVNLTDLDYQTVKGDFGQKNITIDQGNFNMDMEFFDKIAGDFTLADPTLKLILHNSIGIPAVIDAHFNASNTSGNIASIDTIGLVVETPASITSPAVQQIVTFNKDNSDIVEFIALPPSGNISYSGGIHFNPEGEDVSLSNPNFFNLDDWLKIDIGVDLPLKLKLNDLTFSDTVKINKGDLDMIKTAELIINAVNEIPLDIDVQLFFIDTLSHGAPYSYTARNTLLTAAQISDNGVITATTSSNSLSLSETELSGLKNANGVVIKGFVSSPEGGSKTAVIYSESTLDINVVIKSKIDL